MLVTRPPLFGSFWDGPAHLVASFMSRSFAPSPRHQHQRCFHYAKRQQQIILDLIWRSIGVTCVDLALQLEDGIRYLTVGRISYM